MTELERNEAGGIACSRGCVRDAATFDACLASLLDPATDEYPIDVCGGCHVTLEYAADRAAVPGEQHEAPVPCCDGYGQVHHGQGALHYVTLCRNRECLERGVAAWTDPQHETPAPGEIQP